MAIGATINIRKTKNIELTPVNIDYKGYQVPFQYQMWKLKDKSVCTNYSENTPEKSECSIAAKELFNLACIQLSQQKNKDLIAEEMGSNDPFITAKRESACNYYKKIKASQK